MSWINWVGLVLQGSIAIALVAFFTVSIRRSMRSNKRVTEYLARPRVIVTFVELTRGTEQQSQLLRQEPGAEYEVGSLVSVNGVPHEVIAVEPIEPVATEASP